MRTSIFAVLISVLLLPLVPIAAQPAGAKPAPVKVIPIRVIFDTDIGDDIDDAYALALLLNSPEVKIVGITTAFGDTHLRARLVSRLLELSANRSIPVYAGPNTTTSNQFTQAAWASEFPDRTYSDAIAFMLDTIRRNPGKITLISVAPLTNIRALIEKDPATFRLLKRVVIMGGSVRRGYGDSQQSQPEWNILCDIPAAKALFQLWRSALRNAAGLHADQARS